MTDDSSQPPAAPPPRKPLPPAAQRALAEAEARPAAAAQAAPQPSAKESAAPKCPSRCRGNEWTGTTHHPGAKAEPCQRKKARRQRGFCILKPQYRRAARPPDRGAHQNSWGEVGDIRIPHQDEAVEDKTADRAWC